MEKFINRHIIIEQGDKKLVIDQLPNKIKPYKLRILIDGKCVYWKYLSENLFDKIKGY